MLPFGGLETYYLPSSALKSLNEIFAWNTGNCLKTCLSFSGVSFVSSLLLARK